MKSLRTLVSFPDAPDVSEIYSIFGNLDDDGIILFDKLFEHLRSIDEFSGFEGFYFHSFIFLFFFNRFF
jgi:hypothetical protein